MMLSTIVYYVLAASVFLVYGIGLHHAISADGSSVSLILTGVKSLITVSITTTVSYLLVNSLFAPMHLSELFPLVVVIIFVAFSAVIEVFIGIGLQNSITEFAVPLLIVLITINENTSIGYAIIVALSCLTAFYMLLGMVFSLRNRFDLVAPVLGLKVYCLLLISLAVMVIALGAFNVSWLTVLSGEAR